MIHPVRAYNRLILKSSLWQNHAYQRILGHRKWLLKQEDMILNQPERYIRRVWIAIGVSWALQIVGYALLEVAARRAEKQIQQQMEELTNPPVTEVCPFHGYRHAQTCWKMKQQ